MPIDMSGVSAPPKRRAARAPVQRQSAEPEYSQRQMRSEGLQGLGALAQGILNMAGQYADAGAIGMYWPRMATETAKLADDYEVIAKPIDILIRVGPFGALIALGMPLVMQIAANHRLVDASRMMGSSVMPPEVLEAQMKSQIMRQQAEAQREQMEALKEAQSAQAEYDKVLAEMQSANGKANATTAMGV
jgi:hypothetical protein